MSKKEEKDKLLIGRHISLKSPNYLLDSIKEAVEFYKINSFMIYLGSPHSSFRKNLDDLKSEDFKKYAVEKNFNLDNVVIHSSYLVNLGDFKNKSKLIWSINFLKDDFIKVNELGLKFVVMHPGNSLSLDKKESLLNIAKSIDIILAEVPNIKIALETMSGSGTQVGKNFEEIKFIIENSNFKERIGVCWDTCHLYAYGYDIKNNLDSVLEEFDQKIGLEKLWIVHVNDSVFDIGSKKDRHANIGLGKIGLEKISFLCHHEKLKKSIKILETPVIENLNKEEISNIENFFK